MQMQTLYFCPVISIFYLSIFYFPRLISAAADWIIWMSTILRHMMWPSANLECMSETCSTRLAGNTGRKKLPSARHRTTLLGYIFATKACIDSGKKLLNSNISPICAYNMVNFGPLTAEICWRVWGTPANFKGFRVLAALLHGTLAVGVSQSLRR